MPFSRSENPEELVTLYEIAVLLASGDQTKVLERTLDLLEQRTGLLRGTIMLLLPDNTGLEVHAALRDHRQGPNHARYTKGEGVIGRVIETGNPLLVPDITAEPLFKNRIYQRPIENESGLGFVCVPVSIENETVGTLSVDVPREKNETLDVVLRMASIVAAMIAGYLRGERHLRIERESLQRENQRLRSALGEKFRPENLIGASSAMSEVSSRIGLVAQADTTVLIRGPSGTGKELVASAIHYSSNRRDKPFVKVNCAALSESLIESELFGHEKGAFTGASYTRIGRLEEAEGGTLFLDEIGEFSSSIQVKLLRVLQEREFERVGSNKTKSANIRLIAATNKDLEKAVEEGSFREDFYYRIHVFPMHIPPLNQRKDDILPLANHFLNRYATRMQKQVTRISTPAINLLLAYHWPGNVRELENSIEYAVLLSTDGVIYAHNLPPTLQAPTQTNVTASGTLRARIDALERDMIVDALKRSNGNMASAARELGITSRMVRYKVKHLGIPLKELTRPERRVS